MWLRNSFQVSQKTSGEAQTEMARGGREWFMGAEHEEMETTGMYRVPQEERKIFGEVTVSAILSKKVYMYMCPRTFSEIELWMLSPA
jgi:hypothetical protein